MAKPQDTITLVEHRTIKGEYDMPAQLAIIDHPQHGRVLLSMAFGGMGTLRGGMYGWACANRLRPDDTIDSLMDEIWRGNSALILAVTEGRDKDRPWIDVRENTVADWAAAAGL